MSTKHIPANDPFVDQKSTAHTPGPWKYKTAIVSNSPEVFVVTPGNGKWGAPNIAQVANAHDARLIAAAPELLEALELVLNEDRLMNALNTPKTRHIIDAIRSAITKARGES